VGGVIVISKARLRNNVARVTFKLPSGRSNGTVSVVGDWNGWEPGRHEMLARRDGSHSVSVVLTSGTTYRFRYLADGGRWFDDEYADGHDGQNSLLVP
jgi:1,4-alpha-glucan branching enzyme